MDKSVIDRILVEKSIAKMDFYKQIGLTGQGYARMFENDSMKVSTLVKISEVLGVSIIELLGEKPKENGAQALAWQSKLLTCMESKESLYERLVASEEEKVKILLQKEKEIAATRSKQSASSK